MKKVLIAAGVVIIIAIFVVLNLRKEGTKLDVEVTRVEPRDVTKRVTASGQIRARRQVDVSATAIGKVTKLAVEEGDHVERGDFLLQIDPTTYQSAYDELAASIRSAGATLEMEQATMRKVEMDRERATRLFEQNLISNEEMRNADIAVDVQKARVKAADETLAQYRASLNRATHELEQVRITADISGVVTALNVEEGENAIMGTLNNPGTVLLTVADLSEIEAEVEVDETEVVFVKIDQEVDITLDAYPDSVFRGVVTEVGNSAIRSQVGFGQSSVDFKVVILLQDEIPNVRPGLSANAKINVAKVKDALSIPIQCLTVRRRSEIEKAAAADTTVAAKSDDSEDPDVEGVFVVEKGVATYRPVKVGIAGSSYFEVQSGLTKGEKVVSGPFKAINQLKDGDPVKVTEKDASPSS